MAPTYFDQFLITHYMLIPLILLAIIFPNAAFPTSREWLTSRYLTLQKWLITKLTCNLFTPLGVATHMWVPLLIALLMILMTLNSLGLLPYTCTPTTQLSVTLCLAAPIWLTTVVLGLLYDPNSAFAHYLPKGTPAMIAPLLVLIETASTFVRPMALAVRMTANLTAGHLLIQLISSAVMALSTSVPILAMLTAVPLALLTVLEIGVAIIQAYVFILLVTLYLQENT
nr:ATP synthase F0 subunit 6 [Antennatus tuberosus]